MYPLADAPAGNRGHPSRTVTVAYPDAAAPGAAVVSFELSTTRVANGARPHIGRGCAPPSERLCERNTKPPHSA